MATLLGSLIGGFLVAIGFAANFYLFSQWLVYPKQRRRFRVCKPFLAIGWFLYLLGGSILAPLGRVQGSALLQAVGSLSALLGMALTVSASIRLLRANAAERQANRRAEIRPTAEETWPPPPNMPAA